MTAVQDCVSTFLTESVKGVNIFTETLGQFSSCVCGGEISILSRNMNQIR